MQNHVIKANSRLRKSMPTDHDDLKAEGQQSRYRAKNDSSRIEPIRSDSCRVGPNRVDSTSIRAESRRFGFVDPPPYLTPLLAPPPPRKNGFTKLQILSFFNASPYDLVQSYVVSCFRSTKSRLRKSILCVKTNRQTVI